MGATKQKTKAEILTKTIPLFAQRGFDGVSMRQIATVAGINVGSLYHHFPDKQTLYVEALSQAFAKYTNFMHDAFDEKDNPKNCLRFLIHSLCTLINEDNNLSRLMQREVLNGDQKRLQFIIDNIFGDFFRDVNELCLLLDPDCDPHLLTISIIGLVAYHFQLTPLRSFLPGYQCSHNNSEVIANHVFSLLENSWK